MNWLSEASQGVQMVSAIVLSLYGVASGLSLFFGFLGAWFPWALSVAKVCSSVGLRLHNFGVWLGSLLGGSSVKVANQRGFVRLGILVTALCFIVPVLLVQACLNPAAIPGAITLGECIANVATTHPGLSFVEYVAQGVISCGADALAILEEILKSNDPNVSRYKAEAAAVKADPAKLAAFKASVSSKTGRP